MEEHHIKLGNVEIILGRGSRVLKIALIAVLVFSALALTALAWTESDTQKKTAQMKSEAAVYVYENAQLETNIAEQSTMSGKEKIARDELGLVSPDTILIEAQVK